ncbi:MAG TPA: MBL fold metallo-hydrolase [Acidimicrobiales bacterium]
MTDPASVRLTHIGGPTVLIEAAGWRLLTDPTFDAPGRTYGFGLGTSSSKLTGPAITARDVGPVDAVLLTHDHHADNLDDAGRSLLAEVPLILTTHAGASRLGSPSVGLAPSESFTLADGDRAPIVVTATPCRHGPPLSRRLVGDVVGFALEWPGQRDGVVWVSGDTVLHPRLEEAIASMRVGVALLHLGGVRFRLTGPVRYTMTGREAVRLCSRVRPSVAVPVHYEGWSHFAEGRTGIEDDLAVAPAEVRSRFRWLPLGTPTVLAT